MRQVMHLLYAAVFLQLGSSGKPIDPAEKVPEFREFHERIWEGGIDLADNGRRIVYGRVHWERCLRNARDARFDDALRIVSDRRAGDNDTPFPLPPAP